MTTAVGPLGLPCLALENDVLSLAVTTTVGPRILSLRYRGGPNLFAELPDATLDCPGVGPYHLRGGHRFWVAPESAARTYLPDDAPPDIRPIDGGLVLLQAVDESTGLQRTMRLRLDRHGHAVVTVDHVLTNTGDAPVRVAPWAITQLPPGGFAVLPHPTTPGDSEGCQANRCIALWTYTDVHHRDIAWGNAFSFVHARMRDGRLKLGFPNPVGWLGYHRGGTLFVKHAAYSRGAWYFDYGSSSQCYCDARGLELETLGPAADLAPGAATTHREVWGVFECPDLEPTEPSTARMSDALRLGQMPMELGA